jgi:hypothetical protein
LLEILSKIFALTFYKWQVILNLVFSKHHRPFLFRQYLFHMW